MAMFNVFDGPDETWSTTGDSTTLILELLFLATKILVPLQ
jgi:hypothetical protein